MFDVLLQMEEWVFHKYTEATEENLAINLLNSLPDFYASVSIYNNFYFCLWKPYRCVIYEINYTYFFLFNVLLTV